MRFHVILELLSSSFKVIYKSHSYRYLLGIIEKILPHPGIHIRGLDKVVDEFDLKPQLMNAFSFDHIVIHNAFHLPATYYLRNLDVLFVI